MDKPNYSDQNFPVPHTSGPTPAFNAEPLVYVREQASSDAGREFLATFFKHKRRVAVCFLAISLIGTTFALLYSYGIFPKPTYQPTALLMVKFGWENVTPNLSIEERKNIATTQHDLAEQEVRILGSRDLRERAFATVKPETIYQDLATLSGPAAVSAAMVLLDKNLTISSDKTGNVVQVALLADNASGGAAFVNRLVSLYIDRRAEIYKDPKSALFLERKTEEFRQRLTDSENRLKAFRDETQVYSFEEQRTMFLKQKSELAAAAGTSENLIKELTGKLSELEKQLAALPKAAPDAAITTASNQTEMKLLTLQLAEKELLSKYTEEHPAIQSIREQIKIAKEFVASNTKKVAQLKDPLQQDIYKQLIQNQTELSAVKIRKVAIDQQINDLDKRIHSFQDLENANKELMREVTKNDENYRTYRQRLEESRIHDELDRQKMTSVSLIEPASASVFPVNAPKPLYLLFLGVFAAGIFGIVGIVFLLKTLNRTISTPNEAEKHLELPVLVAVPVKY